MYDDSQIHVSSSILAAVCQTTVSSCAAGTYMWMPHVLLVQNQMPLHLHCVFDISSMVPGSPTTTQAQAPVLLFSPSLSTEIQLIIKYNSIYFTLTKFSEHPSISMQTVMLVLRPSPFFFYMVGFLISCFVHVQELCHGVILFF